MTGLLAVETAIPGLFASTPEPLPFAPSLHIRAFVLQRELGNVLIYSTSGLESDAPEIEQLGGISRQYLNHRHEAVFAAEPGGRAPGVGEGGAPGVGAVSVPLFVHEAERASVEQRLRVRGTFSRRHFLDDDLEVIPTPGHTAGATAYMWESGGLRTLFTGDTIYLDDGEWVAAVLESSDRARYLESLELIRELDFDVLVPWAATGGQPYHSVTSELDARRRIDAIIERLRAGGNR